MNTSASNHSRQDNVEPIHSFLQTRNSRYFTATPKNIIYNSFIEDSKMKKKQRYKLRNCRLPQLKIKEEPDEKTKLRLNSYLDLKELMKKKIENELLKKQYDRYCEVTPHKDVIQNLRTQLMFFPSPSKNINKARSQPFKSKTKNSNSFNLEGNRIAKQRNSFSINELQSKQKNNLQEWISSYQEKQKYKESYMPKSVQKRYIERQQIFTPLTGWS